MKQIKLALALSLAGGATMCALNPDVDTYGVYVAQPINGGPSCQVNLKQTRLENHRVQKIFISQCEGLGYHTKFYSRKLKSEKTAKKKCKKTYNCKATLEVKPTEAFMLCRGPCK